MQPSSEIPLSDGHMRAAQPEDGPALCALFAAITMRADLELAVERDPDFFALYALHEAEARTFVLEIDGRIEGLGSVLGRAGYLAGEPVRVGYAGDLRLSPKVRGGRFLGQHFGPYFARCCAELGCEVALTAVITTNQAALRGLVARSDRYPNKPVYRLWRAYSILNVQLTLPRRPRPTALTVRTATAADLPAIADHLAADYRQRPFGEVVDADILRARLARWPGLRIEHFYLAFAGAQLVGVTAPWDAAPVKRFRVRAWRGRMRWMRWAGNALAWAVGAPRLPGVGGSFRYVYLTHVSIVGEDPAVMAALVDRIYADLRPQGYHFFSVCVWEGDPLAPAFDRFQKTALAAGLYTMVMPGTRLDGHDLGAGRPGFEMALV